MGLTFCPVRSQRSWKGCGIMWAQSLQNRLSVSERVRDGAASSSAPRNFLKRSAASDDSRAAFPCAQSAMTAEQEAHFRTSPTFVQPSMTDSFFRKESAPQWGHWMGSPGFISHFLNSFFRCLRRRAGRRIFSGPCVFPGRQRGHPLWNR